MISRRGLLGAIGAVAATSIARAARAGGGDAMPVAYVSHLSPRLAIDPVRGPLLRRWGATLPKPRGIVAMTPHFASRRMALGSTARGFAMYSFPAPMKRWLPPDLDYPSPPSAELAKRVEALICGSCTLDRPARRGLDHTTWMPLLHMFPAHDAPVLEIAYPYVPEREIFALGAKLAPLRSEGILILASGGMTHNLASIDVAHLDEPRAVPSWSSEFDRWAAEAVGARDADALIDWRHRAPAAGLAHPDDGAHYRVLLFALGAALHGPAATGATFPVTGFESTMSARCIELA